MAIFITRMERLTAFAMRVPISHRLFMLRNIESIF
jgi:hypothetical protein